METLVYTVAETCELLKISQRTLFKHIADGKIKRIKLGRRVLISRETIKELLTPQERED